MDSDGCSTVKRVDLQNRSLVRLLDTQKITFESNEGLVFKHNNLEHNGCYMQYVKLSCLWSLHLKFSQLYKFIFSDCHRKTYNLMLERCHNNSSFLVTQTVLQSISHCVSLCYMSVTINCLFPVPQLLQLVFFTNRSISYACWHKVWNSSTDFKIFLNQTMCSDLMGAKDLWNDSHDVEDTSEVNDDSAPVPTTSNFGWYFLHYPLRLLFTELFTSIKVNVISSCPDKNHVWSL